jgi:hypothetical protein
MTSSIKIHLFNGPDKGIEDADFRNPDGTEEETAATGDHHRTIAEIDPATPEQVAFVLEFGPMFNRMMSNSNPVAGFAGLRIGVWPGDNRA